MPKCSVCGHENVYGALVCANCYSLLRDIDASAVDSTIFQPPPSQDSKPQPARRALRDTGLLGGDTVALYMDNAENPLIIQISQQAILGRYTADAGVQPRVDLTPYGAFEKGISRIHAIVRRVEDGLTIEDLGSSNGSWLNGQKLQAYLPSPLKSGDILKLGQITIEIVFK